MLQSKLYSWIAIGLMIVCCGFSEAKEEQPLEKSVDTPLAENTKLIAPWQQLKYGMFIHYGISTYADRDLYSGNQPSEAYAPTALDVDQWIRVARDAGMKYAVLTTKHIAGHCLWDSKVSWRGKEFDYDVGTSSDKTDVVAEFVAACKKYDIKPGFYWCMMDFRNNSTVPQDSQLSAENLPDDFFQLAQDQLNELLNRYPDIGYLWLDIPRAASLEQRTAIYTTIKKRNPDCIVLFNHGYPRLETPITVADFQAAWPTDVLNTERWPDWDKTVTPSWFKPIQTWKDRDYHIGYEHCDTICQEWFWNENDKPRPVKELYQLYKKTTDTGGNLLLNVPPDRTGRIPEYHVKVLMDLKKAIDDPSLLSDSVH